MQVQKIYIEVLQNDPRYMSQNPGTSFFQKNKPLRGAPQHGTRLLNQVNEVTYVIHVIYVIYVSNIIYIVYLYVNVRKWIQVLATSAPMIYHINLTFQRR